MRAGPSLPARSQRRGGASAAAGRAVDSQAAPPDLAQLQQQLLAHPLLNGGEGTSEQLGRLAAVLRADPLLQQAAAADPAIAQLLHPSTMQQALQLLRQQPGAADSTSGPLLQRRALMQLQAYATQLQQARAAGADVSLPQLQAHGAAAADAAPAAGARPVSNAGACDARSDAMWAALQQRLNKYQERSVMLAAAGAQQQAPGSAAAAADADAAVQPTPAAATAPTKQQQQPPPAAPREPRVSEGSATLSELLAAFPGLMAPGGGPTSGSHATIELLSAVGPPATAPPAAAAAVVAPSVPPSQLQAVPGMAPQGLDAALAPSPTTLQQQQQQQQQQGEPWGRRPGSGRRHSTPGHSFARAPHLGSAGSSADAAASDSASGAAVPPHRHSHTGGCFDATAAAGGSAAQQQQHGLRASSLHRILRPSSAGPVVPAGSGIQPLAVERLGSGELLVAITPPTRVTRELSWSLEPDAEYVLEASRSGGFSPLPPGSAAAAAAAATAASFAGWRPRSSCDSLPAAPAAGSGGGSGGGGWEAVHAAAAAAAAAAGSRGPRESTCSSTGSGAAGRPILPPGSYSGYSPSSALGPAAGSAGELAVLEGGELMQAEQQQGVQQQASQRKAQQPAPLQQQPQLQQQHPPPPPQQQQPKAAPRSSVLSNRVGTAVVSSSRSSAGAASSAAAGAAAAVGGPAAGHPLSQHVAWPNGTHHHQHQQQQQAHTDYHQHYLQLQQQLQQQEQQPQPQPPGGAADGHMLDPRSYYERVAPSSWRPSDAAADLPADYLELYRRAYCTYADALFPPLWLALMATLAGARLLPLWALLLAGLGSFWAGLYLMAVRWAGVPPGRLGLSRATPSFVVCMELLCTGAFVARVLPAMWLGHSVSCVAGLACALAVLALHLAAFMQDPGYTRIPDTEEGPCARHLSVNGGTTTAPGGADGADVATTAAAAAAQQQQRSVADLALQPGRTGAAGSSTSCSESAPLLGQQQQQQQQQPAQRQPAPKLAGRSLNSCWSCGVERNLRSKHCPICKRCVERFDHHCPVIGNCIGAGNHRTFVAYLALLVVGQLLFAQLLGGMLVQEHLTTLAAGGGSAVAGLAVSTAQQTQTQTQTQLQQQQGPAGPAGQVGQAAAAQLVGAGSVAGVAGVADGGSGGGGGAAAAAPPPPAAAEQALAALAGSLSAAAGGLDSASAGTASGTSAAVATPSAAAAAGPVVPDAALSRSSASAAQLEQLASGSSWGLDGWWLTLRALWAAAGTQTLLLLLLLFQAPALLISSSLLLRALGLAAANLTVNEWLNRHRYLYLQHDGGGFCNRFDRGPAHNCWEFWVGPQLVDWWAVWQQGDEELRASGCAALSCSTASRLVRFWDARWAKYQQKLLASRERRRELQLQRRLAALGLQPA